MNTIDCVYLVSVTFSGIDWCLAACFTILLPFVISASTVSLALLSLSDEVCARMFHSNRIYVVNILFMAPRMV